MSGIRYSTETIPIDILFKLAPLHPSEQEFVIVVWSHHPGGAVLKDDDTDDERPSVRRVLWNALRKNSGSFYRLAKESGLTSQALTRFARGERDLGLKSSSKLCKALGLELLSPAQLRGQIEQRDSRIHSLNAEIERLKDEVEWLKSGNGELDDPVAKREWLRNRLRVSLSNLLVIADNLGNRPLLRYGTGPGRDQGERLHHLLHGLLEENRYGKTLVADLRLVRAVEIILNSDADIELIRNRGRSLTAETLDAILQGD